MAQAQKLQLVIPRPQDAALTHESNAEAAQRLAREPGGVSLVPDSRWQARSATTIKDMLDFTPGVIVQQRSGAEAARLSIRGSGLARAFQGRGILLTQDGIPINTADGSFDFQELDPWLYQRVEVLRGANALAQGVSTLGGAINFVTPVAQGSLARLRGEGGSFGTVHLQGSAGAREGAQDAHISASHYHQEGFRRQNGQNSARATANTGWRLSPEVETRLYVNAVDTHAEIPGTLMLAALKANPRQGKTANIAGDYSRNLQIGTVASKTVWKRGGESASALLYAKQRALHNPATVYIAASDSEFGFRGRYEHANDRLRMSAGTNMYYGAIDEDRYANNGGSAGAAVVFRNQSALTAESYAQLDYALTPDLRAVAGLQGAYAQRGIKELFPAVRRQETAYWGLSPRLGLRYAILPELEAFGNLSGSFEPPTLSELSGGNAPGFSRLAAQRGKTAELGFRGNWPSLAFELSLYRARLSNEYLAYRFPDGSTDTVNARSSTHSGVELGLSALLSQGMMREGDTLSLLAAYTLNQFHLSGDAVYGDKRLPGVPQHYLRASLSYAPAPEWRISPSLEWTPRRWPVDTANTVYAPGYALLGLSLVYAPQGGRFSAYVEARNLADERAAATTGVVPNAFGADISQFYPVEGRAVYAGIMIDW